MRQVIAISLMLAVGVWILSPGFVGADTSVDTGLIRDTSGGFNPIVKAKWEANGEYTDPVEYYRDDDGAAGAQFLPSGHWQVNKTIALCAIVTDPDGLADIDTVYADVFYPDVALGDSHTPLTDQSGLGCGELMQEDSLQKLTKQDGIDLFCTNVRNNNNNLPTFGGSYNYDEICAADGELMKETAAVYCTTKEISYEDPSGDYIVWAIAQDGNGLQGILENSFTYLPLTAFITDFGKIDYGNVRLNTHKIISGDLNWDTPLFDGTNHATVKNVGNTRLSIKVWQDDMGLGKTDGLWNVKYDARVGSYVSFTDYDPEVTTTLDDKLDLSEMDEMDFSITIYKFPPTHTGDSYIGNMTLSAVSADHLECPTD